MSTPRIETDELSPPRDRMAELAEYLEAAMSRLVEGVAALAQGPPLGLTGETPPVVPSDGAAAEAAPDHERRPRPPEVPEGPSPRDPCLALVEEQLQVSQRTAEAVESIVREGIAVKDAPPAVYGP